MQPRLHVGIRVWPARSDFFFFLRKWVAAHAPNETYRELSLPPDLMAIVSRIEYSPLWIFRFILYRHVVRFLEDQIRAVMKEASVEYREVVFYLPDDGYWAEVFHTIRERVGGRMRGFNLQHGNASLKVRRQFWRRALNEVAKFVSGFPNFGYGFGAGSLDGYIVMSKEIGDFIEENFGTPAYVAPEFIRGDFFSSLQGVAVAPQQQEKVRILFAFNPIYGKKGNLFGGRDKIERKFFADVADSLRVVASQVTCEMRFRFHPGQDREKMEMEYRRAGLDRIGSIDQHFQISDSLQHCDFVLACGSTVLLEGALLGKVPVNFVPEGHVRVGTLIGGIEEFRLHRVGGHPIVETSRGSVRELFNAETTKKYAKSQVELNYSAVLPWLS